MEAFKPNLAGKLDFESLDFENYDYVADYKYDGVRALIIDGQVVSRSLKPIPNKYVQERLGRKVLNGLDGELIVGHETSPTVFRDSVSGVMSADGMPHVRLVVFDDFTYPNLPYIDRWHEMRNRPSRWDDFWPIIFSIPRQIHSAVELLAFENSALACGYEGVMVRRVDRPYKFGRSTNTIRDQGLLKLKRFQTSEATITGFECEYENTNDPMVNALGHAERSHHKANKVAKNTLGRLEAKDLETDVEFSVGIFRGWSRIELDVLWNHRHELIGKIFSYEFFPVGKYEKPRFPVFKGFRDPLDL